MPMPFGAREHIENSRYEDTAVLEALWNRPDFSKSKLKTIRRWIKVPQLFKLFQRQWALATLSYFFEQH